MLTFATGLFIGAITGISISYVLFMWLIHNPNKRMMEDKLTSNNWKENSYLRMLKTKDVIIEKQGQFISWAKMVLSRNRLLMKMGRQGVYLHDN